MNSLGQAGECDGSDLTCVVCAPGEANCDGSCKNVESDPRNCGGCGNACPAAPGPSVCSAGVCACPGGTTLCGGVCSDLTSDPAHCGACGNACGAPGVCSGGTCAQAVFANFGPASLCTPDPNNDNCINQNGAPIQGPGVQGGCNASNVPGLMSIAVSFAPAGDFALTDIQLPLQYGLQGHNAFEVWITASNGAGQPDATSILEDDSFSGEPFAFAQSSAVFIPSSVHPVLQSGVTYWLVIAPGAVDSCGGDLLSRYDTPTGTDFLFDTTGNNIGTSILGGPWLVNGNLPYRPAFEIDGLPVRNVCSPPTPTYCSGSNTCVDTTSDVLNCGACGNQCPAPGNAVPVCNASMCSFRCILPSLTACGGACVSTATDPSNCGTCGNACPPSPGTSQCIAGACVCPSGKTNCGGVCRDLTSDPSNCGACGNACTAPENAAPVCNGSTCGWTCDSSALTACGGACVDTTKDPDNCGSCGHVCPSKEPVCTSGSCTIACPAGEHACGDTCQRNGTQCP